MKPERKWNGVPQYGTDVYKRQAQRDEQNKGIRKQEERVYAALFLFGPVRRGFFCRHPGVPPPGVNAEFPPGKAARRAAPGGNALLIMVREKERFVK